MAAVRPSGPSIKRIVGIHFGLISAAEAQRQSVCEVTASTIYAKSIPVNNGLNDVRMGTVDRRIQCHTCGHSVVDCNGHAGHRVLTVPCYHPCFTDKVQKILRLVCYFCSTLLVSDPSHGGESLTGRERFVYITGNAGKVKKLCPNCHAPQPHYRRQGTSIRMDWPITAGLTDEEIATVKATKFTAYRAWLILKAMTDEAVTFLGFQPTVCHPEALILRTLLIPPPTIRPSIMATAGSRSMGLDDLTRMLCDIVKKDMLCAAEIERVEKAEGTAYVDQLVAMADPLEECALKLQEDINVYFNQEASTSGKVGASSKRRNLAHRLKGKEGRVRGNLNGKRVNQSARTVISPEAELDIHELGIPEFVAVTLTRTEVVCPINHQVLTRCVQIGAGKLGGASGIVTVAGEEIRLDMCQHRDRLKLQYGDRVLRHLRDGDWVVFNRQPSLHKLSMIGLKIRILPGKTFRLSVPVTPGFNADFDGELTSTAFIHCRQQGA
jgi:DNA-directed RNA polymerase II subunit RPB1